MTVPVTKKSYKIGMVSLGCPKNQVDAEQMLGVLSGSGFEITSDQGEADVIVVNTCGFIESAKEESIDAILDAAKMKNRGRCAKVIVTGCLAQRYKGELLKELPEADAVIGTGEIARIAEICKQARRSRRPVQPPEASPPPEGAAPREPAGARRRTPFRRRRAGTLRTRTYRRSGSKRWPAFLDDSGNSYVSPNLNFPCQFDLAPGAWSGAGARFNGNLRSSGFASSASGLSRCSSSCCCCHSRTCVWIW